MEIGQARGYGRKIRNKSYLVAQLQSDLNMSQFFMKFVMDIFYKNEYPVPDLIERKSQLC